MQRTVPLGLVSAAALGLAGYGVYRRRQQHDSWGYHAQHDLVEPGRALAEEVMANALAASAELADKVDTKAIQKNAKAFGKQANKTGRAWYKQTRHGVESIADTAQKRVPVILEAAGEQSAEALKAAQKQSREFAKQAKKQLPKVAEATSELAHTAGDAAAKSFHAAGETAAKGIAAAGTATSDAAHATGAAVATGARTVGSTIGTTIWLAAVAFVGYLLYYILFSEDPETKRARNGVGDRRRASGMEMPSAYASPIS